jgi:hypothetical protein
LPYALLFCAGLLVGKKWDAIKDVVVPFAGDASARFDELYSEAARKVGTVVENIEDRAAEKQHHSRVNGSL